MNIVCVGTGTYVIGSDHCKYQYLTGWVALSSTQLRPTPTVFIPTYCVCGLAESFLLKRSGEMGGFCDSAVFPVLFHLVMTTRPQLLSLPEGEKEWVWQRRPIEASQSVTGMLRSSSWVSSPAMSNLPPQARQLFLVIGTSSYHRLQCWLLETDLEFKKPSQKTDAGISIYIYNLSFFFYYQIWITHSSNFSFFFLFRH